MASAAFRDAIWPCHAQAAAASLRRELFDNVVVGGKFSLPLLEIVVAVVAGFGRVNGAESKRDSSARAPIDLQHAGDE